MILSNLLGQIVNFYKKVWVKLKNLVNTEAEVKVSPFLNIIRLLQSKIKLINIIKDLSIN